MRRTNESAVLEGVRDYLEQYVMQNCETYGVSDPALIEVGESFVLSGIAITPAIIIAGSQTRSDGSPYFTHMTVTVYFALGDMEREQLEFQAKAWKDLLQDAVRDDWTLGGSCLKADMALDIKDSNDGQFASQAMELDLLIDLGGFVHG